jgi:tetratricopeptide (TPR) repeat protein
LAAAAVGRCSCSRAVAAQAAGPTRPDPVAAAARVHARNDARAAIYIYAPYTLDIEYRSTTNYSKLASGTYSRYIRIPGTLNCLHCMNEAALKAKAAPAAALRRHAGRVSCTGLCRCSRTAANWSLMAAAAAASAASDHDASTCFICLEPHSGPGSSQRLLHGGCACRGGSGFGHVTCIAKAAQETNEDMWQYCPTCKQRWTGQMQLGLARAEVASFASRTEGDWHRLGAANGLTAALYEMGQYTEALSLGVATLATARQALGDEDQVTLNAMMGLAAVHSTMGNHALALPLETEALAVLRRVDGVDGDDHLDTMTAASNLALTHMNMENYNAALPLMTEELERTRRLEGDDSADTLISMSNLAGLHDTMGRLDLALPLFHDALQRSRRVLGNRNPLTLTTMHWMALALCNSNDTAAGIALLEEAVAGRTAVLGAEHPSTRKSQGLLDSSKQKQAQKQQVQEQEEQEEDETIAARIRKRRRRT